MHLDPGRIRHPTIFRLQPDPRVVHQDVQPRIVTEDGLCEFTHLGQRGEVRGIETGAPTGRSDLGHEGLAPLDTSTVDDHVIALARERPRDLPPQPRSRAGDEYDTLPGIGDSLRARGASLICCRTEGEGSGCDCDKTRGHPSDT